MMRVKVSDLSVGEIFYIDFEEEVVIPPDFMLKEEKAKLKVNAKLTKLSDFIMLEAAVSTKITGNCGKCLANVDRDLSFSVFEKFVDQQNDEDEIWIYNGKVIDLNEPLAVNTFLHIPMSFLCSEDCLGLCHKCGIDLNSKKCNCKD